MFLEKKTCECGQRFVSLRARILIGYNRRELAGGRGKKPDYEDVWNHEVETLTLALCLHVGDVPALVESGLQRARGKSGQYQCCHLYQETL